MNASSQSISLNQSGGGAGSGRLDIPRQMARELGLRETQVRSTVALLDDGNTIPFIARYRKEMTGELDENALRAIQERLEYLRNLETRKDEVVRLVAEQEKLTPELEAAIRGATKLQEVEDLYRPYRPKRRTRASIAREKGLEPLAQLMLAQEIAEGDHLDYARRYVNLEKGVETPEDALAGAMDIVAEIVSDDAAARGLARRLTFQEGILYSKAADPSKKTEYEMYYDFKEAARTIPPHRVLAMNRGERQEALEVKLGAPDEKILEGIKKLYLTQPNSIFRSNLEAAIADGYKRLIEPSIEREVRAELTEKAEGRAIELFGENLRNLLLQPPVRGRVVLGIDPGFRTGCKAAVVDDTGRLLATATIYPHPPHNKVPSAEKITADLIASHGVNLISIGNGTASRETEAFIAGLNEKLTTRNKTKIPYVIVSEAGASVYSASKLAGEELPQLDVSLRGAVSIARRIQDPLAELVKIDPRSIGVGLYQHDVDQKRLGDALGAVVESAVNTVGVDLNTASPSLLQYVAGIKPAVARAVVALREQIGRFTSREQLKKVPRLGEATFVQCAGFLRIPGGVEPLDNTSVHPESYHLAREILKLALKPLDPWKIAERLGAGVPTVRDIIDALQRPGRDPRDELPHPVFHTDVLKMEDLKPDMTLKGTVRNVVDFGAFVDIGVGQDGLVHVSQLSQKFVRHPSEAVSVGDVVTVKVLSVDLERERISLSMKV